MNGFIVKALRSACLAATGLVVVVGCLPYNAHVTDPCYPDRYCHMARKGVNEAMGMQVNNGHILDQTVWNSHFEPGTSKLTQGGFEHMAYIVRRRPCPDTNVYLQTAQDISYDQANPDRYVEAQNNLDRERVEVVQKCLAAQSFGRGLNFSVVLHDPTVLKLNGMEANRGNRIRTLPAPAGVLPFSVGTTGGLSPANAPVNPAAPF